MHHSYDRMKDSNKIYKQIHENTKELLEYLHNLVLENNIQSLKQISVLLKEEMNKTDYTHKH